MRGLSVCYNLPDTGGGGGVAVRDTGLGGGAPDGVGCGGLVSYTVPSQEISYSIRHECLCKP